MTELIERIARAHYHPPAMDSKEDVYDPSALVHAFEDTIAKLWELNTVVCVCVCVCV